MDGFLIERLARNLYEYGFDIRDASALSRLEPYEQNVVSLHHRLSRMSLNVTLTLAPNMTVSAVAEQLHERKQQPPLFVVGPRITERSAAIFRESGVSYLDAGGNAYIAIGSIYIDVRGRRGELKVEGVRGGVNLMSPKRAQVIFSILTWEQLLYEPVRVLAQVAKVSLGQAQQTLQLLEQYGFMYGSQKMNIYQREALLEQWVQAYPGGLKAKQTLHHFAGDYSVPEESMVPLVVSGESAVPRLLRPETLTLYCETLPIDVIRSRRWVREERTPSVLLYEKFWSDPFALDEKGVIEAPPLLIYADLLASQDSRQREAASEYRRGNVELRAG